MGPRADLSGILRCLFPPAGVRTSDRPVCSLIRPCTVMRDVQWNCTRKLSPYDAGPKHYTRDGDGVAEP